MKNLLLLLVIILASCTRNTNEIESSSLERTGIYYFYTTAKVSNTNIKGIRTTCDVVKFKGGDKKSLSITMYTDNGYFIQTGYHTFNNVTIPFTQLWKDGAQVGTDITLLANPSLKFGSKQTFSIYNVVGTTKWRIARDNIDCLEIELFSESGYNGELYTEEPQVSSPSRFPKINFYPAIEVLENGQWIIPSTSFANAITWGIEGQKQNQSLKFGELNIGSSINILPYGTKLWENN